MGNVIVKTLVFIVNFILWICGILLIVFGAIAVGDPDTMISILNLIPGVAFVTAIIDVYPLFEGVAIFMIVLGSLLFLFGGVGCHGAYKMHKRMIMHYWLLLIVGVLTEVALIIYAAVFPPTMNTYVQDQMFDMLNTTFEPVQISGTNVTYNTNISGAWEALQSQTHCCGVFGYEDYSTFSWDVVPQYPTPHLLPPTCCVSTQTDGSNVSSTSQWSNLTACLGSTSPTNYYKQGCWEVAINLVWQFDYIAIGISGALMVAQLFGIMLTVHTWHRLVREEGGM
jgi:hypothetical protein